MPALKTPSQCSLVTAATGEFLQVDREGSISINLNDSCMNTKRCFSQCQLDKFFISRALPNVHFVSSLPYVNTCHVLIASSSYRQPTKDKTMQKKVINIRQSTCVANVEQKNNQLAE
jgi:hypothetical protein